MDILEKYKVNQTAVNDTYDTSLYLGTFALKAGLDYFRFVLGTYEENSSNGPDAEPMTIANTITKNIIISNNHNWDELYDSDVIDSSLKGGNNTSGLQSTKDKILNNYFYCIGTMDFTSKTESTLSESEKTYINEKYTWKKFNGSITVKLDTSYKTYVWMIGSNVWAEDNINGYTDDAINSDYYPKKGYWKDNAERINFKIESDGDTSPETLVDISGAYGSLCWGNNSENWQICPKTDYSYSTSDRINSPRITFRNTKIGNAANLYLFNNTEPWCYAGLFKGSLISKGPNIGSGIIDGHGRIDFAEYSGAAMFKNCTALTSYTFNNKINISGQYCLTHAFNGCKSLVTANIPVMLLNGNIADGPPVAEVGGGLNIGIMDSCFDNCTKLTTINLNITPLNITPNGAKPSKWDYLKTIDQWYHSNYRIANLFSNNVGNTSEINKLNIKNVDNVIGTTLANDGITELYHYGDDGNATQLYEYFYIYNDIPNISNWKLQINGSDFKYNNGLY